MESRESAHVSTPLIRTAVRLGWLVSSGFIGASAAVAICALKSGDMTSLS
jgi:hypothetical protein